MDVQCRWRKQSLIVELTEREEKLYEEKVVSAPIECAFAETREAEGGNSLWIGREKTRRAKLRLEWLIANVAQSYTGYVPPWIDRAPGNLKFLRALGRLKHSKMEKSNGVVPRDT